MGGPSERKACLPSVVASQGLRRRQGPGTLQGPLPDWFTTPIRLEKRSLPFAGRF